MDKNHVIIFGSGLAGYTFARELVLPNVMPTKHAAKASANPPPGKRAPVQDDAIGARQALARELPAWPPFHPFH